MTKLSASTLEKIPQKIPKPQYNFDDVSTGILHFGVGGFHRSHMAMALNSLMNQGEALDWGICGVGLLPRDQRLRDVFRTQDCLYTLVLKNSDGTRTPEVIGSIREYLFAPDNPEAVLKKLSDPSIKIVSLTITEGGYNFDRVTGEFDFTNADVQHDLDNPDSPKTVFGYVTEGLRRRRNAGIVPFTVLSCDNIQGNGHVAKDMFSAFARAQDAELGEWISQNVVFPNSMVDRITPVTTDEDIAEVEGLIGMTDSWPVVAEPYFQWVVEDTFTMGRPPFEHVDVQMVEDVMPYELMKLRLLNASHQGLCYFGYLSGYRYAHEAMQDPAISTFLREYMDKEATPTLLPVPGIDLTSYKNQLIERFSNPEVKDTLARLCAESSDRIPKWLVPVIQEQLANNGDVTLSAAIVASWARYAEAVDEQGNPINVVDPLKDELIPIAQSQRENSLAFIQNQKLFGTLSNDKKFAHAYVEALNSLHSRGARETVLSLT
jgi:mannitol 2-dehydrogenase